MKKILLIIAITFLIFQIVVLATVIDIGNEAIDRGTNVPSGTTFVDNANPANETGTITQIEIYPRSSAMNGAVVATFFVVSGNYLTARDHVHLATGLPYDQKVVLTTDIDSNPIALDVEAGDWIGIYFTGGSLEVDSGLGTNMFSKSLDQTECVNTLFGAYGSGYGMSLKGIGSTEAPPAEANAIFFGMNF